MDLALKSYKGSYAIKHKQTNKQTNKQGQLSILQLLSSLLLLVKIDHSQRNDKCRLFADMHETVNHISERVYYLAWLGWRGGPLVIVQEIKIWLY